MDVAEVAFIFFFDAQKINFTEYPWRVLFNLKRNYFSETLK